MKTYSKFIKSVFLPVITALLLCSCRQTAPDTDSSINHNSATDTAASPVSKSSFKLNTIISITLYDSSDEKLIDECFKLCDYYEEIFSSTISTSETARLNTEKTLAVSDEMLELLELSLKYCRLSDGVFDISIAPVSFLWDFQAQNPSVPDKSLIEQNIAHVNYNNISISGNMVTLNDSAMSIDLGAVAKGYIADRLKDYLVENGVTSAIIDLGGNILLIGSKPGNIPFNIGIRKPFYSYTETAAIMKLSDISIVSSGVYERCFSIDNVLYHHLLDTQTGYPVNNGLTSVTIIAPESAEADILSTATFLLGLDKGLRLINSLDGIYAVFITDDGTLHYSDGFKDAIEITDSD